MKKIMLAGLFLFSLILMGSQSAFAAGGKTIAVGVNASLVDMKEHKAMIVDGTAYSPLEAIVKGLRANTNYDSNTQVMSVHKYGKGLEISIVDNRISTSEGVVHENLLKEIDGTTYIPIRFIGEYFGFTVTYLSPSKVVRLYNENNTFSHNKFLSAHKKALDNYFYVKPKKVAYITIDDGPNGYTSQILDILKKKEAKATFFMIERNIKRYPSVVKRMVSEGHYPGLHSVTHDKNKLYNGSPKNVAVEMETTRRTLLSVTGFDSHLTRVPYGSKPYMTKSYRDYMAKSEFKMWDWTIDSEDWKYAKYPKTVVNKVKIGVNRAERKKQSIVILLHDSKVTVSVLPEIIDTLRKEGYELVAYDPKNHKVVNFWEDARL